MIALNAFALDGKDPAPLPTPTPPVVGGSSVSIEGIPFFADKNNFDQILNNPFFIQQFTALTSALEAQWPEITTDVQSRFSKEIDRYNLSTVFGLQGNKLKILGTTAGEIETNIKNFAITADLYYRLELRPSYRDGKQMRKDIYVIGLKGTSSITAGAEIRITFFREFDSKADALKKILPYGLKQIPRTADDVITKLKIQDGVRIETLANLEISEIFSNLLGSTNLSAILGYELFEGVAMLDVYRYTATDVRARIMGTLNRGTVKGEVGLNWLSNFKVPRIMPRWIRELFEVNFNFRISKSFNFFNKYPIETHVADYFFRFNSDKAARPAIASVCRINASPGAQEENAVMTAEGAFNEIMENVWTGNFTKLFNPNMDEEQLALTLNQNASQAEMLACLDRNVPTSKKRVQHFFKGRMVADIFSMDFGPKISQLIRNTSTSGNSEVHVSSLEAGSDFNYYILLNNFSRSQQEYFFGRWETEYITDFDALYQSDKNKNVVQFLDFVKRIQYRDKSMSTSDLKDMSSTINRSIPQNLEDRETLLALLPKTEQRDAMISLVYTLSAQVLVDIEKMDRRELYFRISEFIEKHPEKRYMNVPAYTVDQGPNFTEFVNNIYFQIVKLADSNEKSQERFIALKNLMGNKVFTEYIFRELFPSFLSSDKVNEAMSLTMSVSSKEMALSQNKVGTNQYSSVYEAVLLLRSILNDRSLDLRLESVTQAEGLASNPVHMNGFRIY